jgi:hypothetical protein
MNPAKIYFKIWHFSIPPVHMAWFSVESKPLGATHFHMNISYHVNSVVLPHLSVAKISHTTPLDMTHFLLKSVKSIFLII